jgi:uncharacterized protein
VAKNKVPLVEGLFSWPADKPRLIGSRCKVCGTMSFPKQPFCPNPDCKEKTYDNVEVVQLSNTGTIYTWTVQVYPPAPPFKMEPFAPFPIGMIDLPEGLRVLAMLTTDKVEFGQEVEMTTRKLFEDDKNEYITWAFQPIKK